MDRNQCAMECGQREPQKPVTGPMRKQGEQTDAGEESRPAGHVPPGGNQLCGSVLILRFHTTRHQAFAFCGGHAQECNIDLVFSHHVAKGAKEIARPLGIVELDRKEFATQLDSFDFEFELFVRSLHNAMTSAVSKKSCPAKGASRRARSKTIPRPPQAGLGPDNCP